MALAPKPGRHYIPLLVAAATLLTLVIVPLKIAGYGYLPPDDALRHAAKVISGRSWQQIMVMRPEITIDHNFGWHKILGAVHSVTGWDTDALVVFSTVILFILVTLSALPWLRRPEAWLLTFIVMSPTGLNFISRFMLGRPFLVTTAVLITILLAWGNRQDRPSRALMIGTTLLIALSVWVHGSWYLFAVPLAAFALARRWRATFALGVCWMSGTVIGACATGYPIRFVVEQLRVMRYCFEGDQLLQRMLVLEFQPFDGAYPVVALVALVLIWRLVRRTWSAKTVNNPIFILAVLGWVLGFKVARFWLDWGWPAALVWMTREFQEVLENWQARDSVQRLAVATFAVVAFFLGSTSDLESRWTRNLSIEYLTPDKPALAGWLPGDNGIIYSDDVRVFYRTFFKNPKAGWRYMPGYEVSFMPPEDLRTFRRIQRDYDNMRSFEPWVRKMRPEDRLILYRRKPPGDFFPQLEWLWATSDLWIGRLRQGTRS